MREEIQTLAELPLSHPTATTKHVLTYYFIAFIKHYSLLSSRFTVLMSHLILNEWLYPFIALLISTVVVYWQHYSVVAWLVPHETAAISILFTPYNHAPVYSATSLKPTKWPGQSDLRIICSASRLSAHEGIKKLRQVCTNTPETWANRFHFIQKPESTWGSGSACKMHLAPSCAQQTRL